MSTLRFLCFTALVSVWRLSEAVGPVVRCEPCDAEAMIRCKPLPKDCAERVREPGCGCCMTCALTEGQSCGIYTGRCGSGLTCQHRAGETRPLLALLEGRGICSRAASKKLSRILVPANGQDNAVVLGEDRGSNRTGSQVTGNRGRLTRPKVTLLHPKVKVIGRDQSKKSQSYKVGPAPARVGMDVQNFSFDSKQEAEYGPCRREMESVLNSLKVMDILNPRGFRIPNCDKKGFYKKKQCRPSKGRRRGVCWCVDKYGQPLPGFSGKGRGDAQCYSLENQ
ncbi:hypothetical protein MATL_G00253810 [Megalops atlanticus]|uniref:Insulin-like growth factor-binding protein 3 n=1 Tax=Megalops atlanticus TaxID=7932 RepID=A0A9D3SUH3_MEGAT|nr:hypothetical protein MATL_G00253810 [Megalops atlanticus]